MPLKFRKKPKPKIKHRNCACPGFSGCQHSKGTPCDKDRYGDRLYCNRCGEERRLSKSKTERPLINKTLKKKRIRVLKKPERITPDFPPIKPKYFELPNDNKTNDNNVVNNNNQINHYETTGNSFSSEYIDYYKVEHSKSDSDDFADYMNQINSIVPVDSSTLTPLLYASMILDRREQLSRIPELSLQNSIYNSTINSNVHQLNSYRSEECKTNITINSLEGNHEDINQSDDIKKKKRRNQNSPTSSSDSSNPIEKQ